MPSNRREVAKLTAFDAEGIIVEEVELDLHDYYDELHDLIDSDEYRAARGIVAVEGKLFDPSGNLFQEFRTEYSAAGAYVRGRAVHADGTIVGD